MVRSHLECANCRPIWSRYTVYDRPKNNVEKVQMRATELLKEVS